MKFAIIPITERLPTAEHFKHPLDKVVFNDVNAVKFLIEKQKASLISQQEWIDQGFFSWLEETLK
ncbi:hypothetical protein PQ465_12375 [Sphingobacterium oryzagri]|uniref:Uncharacterized protein n=1 Tax=Sphingobacterium oryzagri TaxID=3025669 RepID=A0ABY7WBR3_9SPHI|nr:hypothetical protein [Sphingobacterium sp. KACC 22765]WDF67102.1 hypothetical protein PQ465_12375 [Sphingobacterium sp. KACC 22765]